MADLQNEESQAIELEVNEDDILYYITDQDDNEIGFAVLENGEEVEYFYETETPFKVVEVLEEVDENDAASKTAFDETVVSGEAIEMEVNENDIVYYIVDQDDNEIGFAVLENGVEVEYFYAEDDASSQTASGAAGASAQSASASQQNTQAAQNEDEAESLFSAEQLSEVKDDMIGLLKDGASLAKEFKDAYADFNEVMDFLPKRRR